MTWTMMRDSPAPGNRKTEIWWESEATEDDDAAVALSEVSELLGASEEAMHLLEQAADTIHLDRGEETTGTGKLRTCAIKLHRLLGK